MSSIIKVQNIQYTDGDAALTIADGGGVTAASTLTSTGDITANNGVYVNGDLPSLTVDKGGIDRSGNTTRIISGRAGGNYADMSFNIAGVGGINRQVYIDYQGNVTLDNGDIVFGTAGKGICLGATSVTAANTLHDYEEGLWNPIIYGTTTGDSTAASRIDTFSTRRYCKIGSLVFCSWYCVGQSTTTQMTGNLTMGGLPFSSNGNYVSSGSVHYNMGTPGNSGDYFFRGANAGNTVITFLHSRDNASWQSINAADAIPNNTAIYWEGTITYLTDS